MQADSTVSIIMPTHNRAHLVRSAIESVLRQTYSNWELLIIDDASTDDTQTVIAPFLNDGRISLHTLSSNAGGAGARNFGISKAQGEFIAFLDDDDEWLGNKLEKQLKIFSCFQEIAIVSCNYFLKSGDKRDLSRGYVSLDDLFFTNRIGSFSFCITKGAFVRDLWIDTALKACQDWDLWIKILQKTGLLSYIHEDCLVRYNDLDGQRLTKNRNDSLTAFLQFLRMNWEFMDERQRLYNLSVLTSRRNYIQDEDLFYKIRLSFKAIGYCRRSSYNYNVANILKYLGHILSNKDHIFRFLKKMEWLIV